MNIAIIGSRGFPSTYGGYETLVRHVARRWSSQGHEVTVYCRQRPAHGRRRWLEEGVQCVWTPGHDSQSASTLTFGLTSQMHAVTQQYDAALVLNIANGLFLPMLRARGIPTVLNTDGIEWERGKWGPLARKFFYRGAVMSARYADVLVCDSRAIGAIWEETFSVQSRHIPYGAPVLEDIPADRVTALGFRPGEYLLVVARLIPENNVDLTLDALECAGDRIPAVVVGSANAASPIERRLRKLDHSGAIRWLGHVDDQNLLTQLWAHCGVYVHGHSVGGTNPALLQALGAGAPTLALDTPFNREVLGSSEQVFSRDPQELRNRVESILGDESARLRWASHGRSRIAEAYNWPAVADDYIDALRAARALRA